MVEVISCFSTTFVVREERAAAAYGFQYVRQTVAKTVKSFDQTNLASAAWLALAILSGMPPA